ncbi:hypothetical protein KP509_09G059200 [Ceratopteris richardii]|uniref:Protein kinase domain-containing protein n=1 Tax=Ceratopteris richardii TaxID=49495 RepID=A0A8T2U777_CERRI|nr:hypothetical protein KP509_09G059200 [Ceratopteris richardii]KAH7429625.1 hypothetical protein KP509_09G059200 [Ceratopteris richardii]
MRQAYTLTIWNTVSALIPPLLLIISLGYRCASQHSPCPSSCSSLAPIPYPFGAAEGCGAPGFLLSNCSALKPQWNLTLGDTMHVYYIERIFSTPNSSNHSSVLSYGYGGAVLLSLPVSSVSLCNDRDPLSFLIGSPQSGNFTRSSKHCADYLKRCELSKIDRCLEYSPDQELYLPALMTSYNCSSFRRFVIDGDDESVDEWTDGTQFAWGVVDYAEQCSACEDSGGICGYELENKNFLCHCGSASYVSDCNQQEDADERRGLVIGLVVASVLIFALAVIASLYFLRQTSCCWRMFGDHKKLNLERINQAPIEFPIRALKVVTKSFKTEIGRGAYGKVYKGVLPDGTEVAVKVLDTSMLNADEQFRNEAATMSNIHHVNVARLLGFYFSKSRKILVYEYVCHSSLDKYLFRKRNTSCLPVLSWTQRFNIAVGIARGLSYMHEECHGHIIHCDIKPQNILLDASFLPKITDFGLAKLLAKDETRILTRARGTPGYVAPEFWSLGRGPLTSKFDVYSYGIVLLEIIRGQRCAHIFDPFSLQQFSDDQIEIWGSTYVDERIAHDYDLKQAQICTSVAFWCIQEHPDARPTMQKVVEYLQGLVPVPKNPPAPFKKLNLYCEKSFSQIHDSSLISSSMKTSEGPLYVSH